LSEEPRIGVFVCHCGTNIAGSVNVKEVVEYASKLPGVVYATDNRYSCSDPGQEQIRKAIKEYKLNRVVVAACSPRMHEPTFRKCVEEAGLNPYLFEMANIREHCSWPHYKNPEAATEKAKDIVAMAVAKARLLEPLEKMKVPITKRALVIGGGIAGINAALSLADMGYETILVEKKESIGGVMAALDKCFPTLDCSICIEGPKMVEVARHPNIKIISYAEVEDVEGYVGNFKVRIRKKPRYVIEERCTGCGECEKVCPIEYPNEWDLNMASRKAISIPFPQAVPLVYTINRDVCIECYACVDACGERRAIDFTQKEEIIEIEVGVIIVAVGYDLYIPTDNPLYGYGRYPNVITTMELERIILAAGPTGGKLLRPSDGKKPHRIAFIQCVGSRDVNKYPYCSGFCCMYTIKNAILLKEKYGEDLEIYIFYMDMRTNFKGYEEFYRRAREMGIKMIRGRPSEILEDPETRNLIIRVEDVNLGENLEIETELVVLSTAAIPSEGSDKLAAILHIPRGTDGFFLESHLKLKPLDTPVDGIFLAGSCQGPKDITYSVSQGIGAAARAASILSKDEWEIEPIVAYVTPETCRNTVADCGVCTKKCPYGAIVAKKGEHAVVNVAMCHGCGTCVADCPMNAIQQKNFTDEQIMAQIREALKENPEKKIIAFFCNWCAYAGADLAGTSRFEYPPNIRIIRVMCSGRVDRDFVLEAFRLGARGVLIGACHLPSDCHYISGNWRMKERMEILAKLLQKRGISPERFRVEYISAAEGLKFAQVAREMEEQISKLGEERIKQENESIRGILEALISRGRR